MCLGLGEHGFDELASSRFRPRDTTQLLLGNVHGADQRVAVPFEVCERKDSGSAPGRHSAHRLRA
jgi:hypothetical protein